MGFFFNVFVIQKKAAKWRGEKYKHYSNLWTIFGKDRATGKDAFTAVDEREELGIEDVEEVNGAMGDGLDEINNESSPNSAPSQALQV